MRRIVATLLVVASPLLMVAPVGASEARTTRPAAPAVVQLAAQAPAPAPATPVQAATVAPPAPPAAATPAILAPAVPAVTHPAVHTPARAIRPKAPSIAGVDDTAYTARLQADLCQARQIFCGLDHGGHYPAR